MSALTLSRSNKSSEIINDKTEQSEQSEQYQHKLLFRTDPNSAPGHGLLSISQAGEGFVMEIISGAERGYFVSSSV